LATDVAIDSSISFYGLKGTILKKVGVIGLEKDRDYVTGRDARSENGLTFSQMSETVQSTADVLLGDNWFLHYYYFHYMINNCPLMCRGMYKG